MKEKLKHFWYYNKTVIFVLLLIFAAGIYLFLQKSGTEKADYDIAVVSPHFFSDEERALLRSALEETGEDITGDGSVLVMLHFYQLAIGQDGEDSTQIGALDADLVGNVSGIFLLSDPAAFEEATNGICKAASSVPLSDCSTLSELGFEELFLAVREKADEKYAALADALAA